jgi:hypothetical protein
MTKTAKSTRLTKAQKLAMIELETQAVEAQIAQERGEKYVPPVIVDPETLTIKAPAGETTEAPAGETTEAPAEAKALPKTQRTGVGKQILQLIAEGKLTNKEIVAKVLEDNPDRKTTYACVAWYKSQVKAGRIDLPKVEA